MFQFPGLEGDGGGAVPDRADHPTLAQPLHRAGRTEPLRQGRHGGAAPHPRGIEGVDGRVVPVLGGQTPGEDIHHTRFLRPPVHGHFKHHIAWRQGGPIDLEVLVVMHDVAAHVLGVGQLGGAQQERPRAMRHHDLAKFFSLAAHGPEFHLGLCAQEAQRHGEHPRDAWDACGHLQLNHGCCVFTTRVVCEVRCSGSQAITTYTPGGMPWRSMRNMGPAWPSCHTRPRVSTSR